MHLIGCSWMVERCTWVALGLSLVITSGCPQPGDEAGDDEVGESSASESGSTGETDRGETDRGETDAHTSVIAAEDDIQAPDDANPETSETSESGDGDGDGDGDDDDDDDDDDDGDDGDCWDLSSADGELPIVVVDDTTSMSNDQIGSCAQFPAPDFSFGFEAPFTGEFVFDTAGSSFDTLLYVDDGECGVEELECNDDFIGLSSRIVLPLVAGETVTVVVDGYDADQVGPFVLTIDEYQPPMCVAQSIPPALPKIVLGDTSGGSNQHAGGCGGAAAPDDMYRFVAPGPGPYRFHTFGSAFDTVLYVWDECDGPELGCSDDANLELQSEVVVELAGGQEVWVVVDGVDGASGPYQLNVQKL